MNLNIPERPSKLFYFITLIILSLGALWLVICSTNLYGAAISPDSVGYISAARSILKGLGISWFDGSSFVGQPPLYPVLLAAFSLLLNTDPLISTRIINAFLFGLIIYLSGILFFRHFNKKLWVPLLGVTILLFLPILISITVLACSEPLFIVFTLLFIYFQEKYILQKDLTSFLLFTFSAALACLTRYIGITLVISGILALLFLLRADLKYKIKYLLIFLIFSVLPTAIWVIRNYFISGTFTGERAASLYSLKQNIVFTLFAILNGFFPGVNFKNQSIFFFAGVLLFVLIIISFLIIYKKPKRFISLYNNAGTLIVFVAIYIAFLILSSTTTAYDKIDSRLLSPIYIPVTLLLLLFIEKLIKLLKIYTSSRLIAILPVAGIFIWFLYYPVKVTFAELNYRREFGAGGYNTKEWKESKLINYLQIDKLNNKNNLYSNAPDALYILTDIKSLSIPFKTAYNSDKRVNSLDELKKTWLKNDTANIIWFNKIDRKFLFSIYELQQISDIQLIKSFSGGEIYQAVPKQSQLKN